MSTYTIGDVHGCLAELKELLLTIQFKPKTDRLLFLGDIVGRGPNSLEVLRLLYSLREHVTVILGNHDLHLLALQYHQKLITNFFGTFPHLQDIFDAPDCQVLLDWLRKQPLLHHAETGHVLTHAGIYPQWDLMEAKKYAVEIEQTLRGENYVDFLWHMYGNRPSIWDETLTGWERLRFITNCFTRMRFCDINGNLNLTCKTEIGSQPPKYVPWFAIPKRKCKNVKIVFGHWAALRNLVIGPPLFALDTGCIWGGRLTAMRLEDERRFEVKCHT